MTRAAAWALLATTLWRCDSQTLAVNRPRITITAPAAGAHELSYEMLTFSASVQDGVNITSFTLAAGSVTLLNCPGIGVMGLDCSTQFTPTDVEAQISNGTLSLTASAVDAHGSKSSQNVVISVKPIRVSFVAPMAPAGSTVATVMGTSALTLDAESEVAITDVSVSDMKGLPIHDFGSASPYSTNIDWPAFIGVGADTLVATATDTEGNTDTAMLDVLVQCSHDGDCNVGQSCCVSSGACYPTSMSAACQ